MNTRSRAATRRLEILLLTVALAAIGLLVSVVLGQQAPHTNQDHSSQDGFADTTQPADYIILLDLVAIYVHEPSCYIELKDRFCRTILVTPETAIILMRQHLNLSRTGCYEVCADNMVPHFEMLPSAPCGTQVPALVRPQPPYENGGPKIVCFDEEGPGICEVYWPTYTPKILDPCISFELQCVPGCPQPH